MGPDRSDCLGQHGRATKVDQQFWCPLRRCIEGETCCALDESDDEGREVVGRRAGTVFDRRIGEPQHIVSWEQHRGWSNVTVHVPGLV